MKYKFKFLIFFLSILFFNNIFSMDLDTELVIIKENFLTQIKQNNIEQIRKMATEYPFLVNAKSPIPPIIYAIGIENTSYKMIKTLIELHSNVNTDNPEFKSPLSYIINKIYSANTIGEHNYFISILKLLLENGAIVTKEILQLCGNDEIKRILLKRTRRTITEEHPFKEDTNNHCSLM